MTGQPIYTIGYGSRTIEALSEIIRARNIQYLIDVRSRPYSSYKPEFNKQALEIHLKNQGLEYLFMGDSLGGLPDDPACYTNGKVDYDIVREKPFYIKGIKRLIDASNKGITVVVMCSEEKPEGCHRSKLIGRSLEEIAIDVIHIDENNLEISQREAMLRVSGGQPSLFGENFSGQTSRKRYGIKREDLGAAALNHPNIITIRDTR